MAGYGAGRLQMQVSCRPMCGVDKWDEAPALCYVEEPTVDVRDLPADIRCKIDDIIHNHEDLQSQMDAVDALLYGNRQASDIDAESGIETGDSDSATASVASSEYAAAAAGVRRDNTSAVSMDTAVTSDMTSCSDEVGEFIRLTMVHPPPSPVHVDQPDFVIVPPPIDVVNCGCDITPTSDYLPHGKLPTLVEVPEDDASTLSYQYDADLPCIIPRTPPMSRVEEFTEPPISRGVVMKSCDNETELHHGLNVDENSNCVLVSADTAVVSKQSSCAPVPAKRTFKTTMVNSANHVIDEVSVSRPSTTEDTTSTTMWSTKQPVSASDDTSWRMFSTLQLSHRHYSGDTETNTDSRKKTASTNIWKRFLKRDAESSDMPSSTGISWSLFPRRKSMTLQSASVAESTATLRRYSKNKSTTTSTQWKFTPSTAARARDMPISLPFDFRDLTNVGENAAQRTSGEKQLKWVSLREVNRDGLLLAGQETTDNEGSSLASDDDYKTTVSSDTHSKASRNSGEEQGDPINATVDPHLHKSTSLICLPGDNDEKRNIAKNVPTGDQSSDSPISFRRTTLVNIGATLPRLYRRLQSLNEDQSTSIQRWSDPPEVECHDDDLSEVTRTEYLQTAVTGKVRPSPAAETNQLLRRSMTEEPPPTSPLFGLIDSLILDDNDRQLETVSRERFDTFKGELKPMRWSEECSREIVTNRFRSQSVDCGATARRHIPAYVDVRPPLKSQVAVSNLPQTIEKPVLPVAAPRSVPRDKQRSTKSEKLLKLLSLQQSADSHVIIANDAMSPAHRPSDSASDDTLRAADCGTADVIHRPKAEVNDKMTSECRMSSSSANSDDVFVANADSAMTGNYGVDDTQLTTSDENLTTVGLEACDIIHSVESKTYSKCPCAEAIRDIEAMMMALERLRSSCEVIVPTTLLDANCATGDLSTSARQLVTDSKHLVAGAMNLSSNQEERLCVLVETTMHTLATVFLHCCQLFAIDLPPSHGVVADVAQHTMEAARSLRTTVEAVRTVLEAQSDAVETKKALLTTASLLAKSLSALVHTVKNI